MAAVHFPKPVLFFVSAVDWGISSKLSRRIDFHLLKLIPSLNLNPEVHSDSMAAILKNLYDVITIHTSKPKAAIEFQNGGRPFSETRGSFIDLQILNRIQSLNLSPEVHLRLYGRHLEKLIWHHNSAPDRPITTKFGRQVYNDMPLTIPSLEIETGNRIPKWWPSVFWNRT